MRERKSNRLRDYDYSESGYYFVTICTQNREEWFGEIRNGEIFLNKYGKIAQDFWTAIPHHFSNVSTDAFSIMPNHIHGILIIEREAVAVGNAYMRSLQK